MCTLLYSLESNIRIIWDEESMAAAKSQREFYLVIPKDKEFESTIYGPWMEYWQTRRHSLAS